MQAHSRWLHAIRKQVISQKKKHGVKKYKNTKLFLQGWAENSTHGIYQWNLPVFPGSSGK